MVFGPHTGKQGERGTDHNVLTWNTYSGKTADPRWESSSSSMVKPLQLTWTHIKKKARERRRVIRESCMTSDLRLQLAQPSTNTCWNPRPNELEEEIH